MTLRVHILLHFAALLREAREKGYLVVKVSEEGGKIAHLDIRALYSDSLDEDSDCCVACIFEKQVAQVEVTVEALKDILGVEEVVLHDAIKTPHSLPHFGKGTGGEEGEFDCGTYPTVDQIGMEWSFDPVTTK